MKLMKMNLKRGLLLGVCALLLSGCGGKIITGNFCDMYERVEDADSEQTAGNNAVYDGLCML